VRGTPLELWPVISYGNPGNATVLNNLMESDTATEQFITDAIAIAHKQNLTGFNWDLEPTGSPGMNLTALITFMNKFISAMHGATPPIGVSYDGGNDPIDGVTGMDRWVSMST
jgi:spore germination protein YaaH